MDAAPDHKQKSPDPTIWPLISAVVVTVMFIWSIFTPWAVVYMSLPVAAALIAWFWPKEGKPPREQTS
jgi:cytochrome c oxidase subunit 1